MANGTPYGPFEVRPAVAGEVVFRVISSEAPSPADFLSDEEAGHGQNLPRHQNMAIYRGFSVRKTLNQAQSLARSLGKSYVAEVELSPHDADAIARTFKPRGHHTVWAQPHLIAARVTRVHGV